MPERRGIGCHKFSSIFSYRIYHIHLCQLYKVENSGYRNNFTRQPTKMSCCPCLSRRLPPLFVFIFSFSFAPNMLSKRKEKKCEENDSIWSPVAFYYVLLMSHSICMRGKSIIRLRHCVTEIKQNRKTMGSMHSGRRKLNGPTWTLKITHCADV